MVIGAISIMGCSGKKKNFSPNEPGRADITKSSVITDSVEGENAVKLTIMVQKPSSDFPQNAAQALESKMLTIASKNGIVGYGGDPAFVLAALITPLGKDVTTTAPVKKVMKYTLNLYVANVVTGDVYGASSMDIMGIGNSFELAALNAITSVDDNSNIQKMLHEASNKIISWYQNHSKEFISKVSDYITHEEFDSVFKRVIYVLNSMDTQLISVFVHKYFVGICLLRVSDSQPCNKVFPRLWTGNINKPLFSSFSMN